jgi:fatty-acyl-CoA synthase
MGIFDRIRSEYLYFTGALRMLKRLKPLQKNPNSTLSDVISRLAEIHKNRIAFYYLDQTVTYGELEQRANRYAHWAQSIGIQKGDVVALLMPNKPEYVIAWLGIIRAGGVAALLNTNLTGTSLAHCISIVKTGHLIVDKELEHNLKSALPHLKKPPVIWAWGGSVKGAENLDKALDSASSDCLDEANKPALTINDPALYIYTSGTTGLPKAANISHYRVQSIMNGFSAAVNAKPDDRMYIAMPLYHSSGGVLALGTVLTVGGAAILRDTFSARNFWSDCVKYEATMFQYIGELCRYLLNSPPDEYENKHKIRLCCGNGLRPDVWGKFRDRFGLTKILEFYGATEGNVVLLNYDSKPGSVGRIPKWAEKIFNTEIVEFDMQKEAAVRGVDGFCIKCAPGIIGEVIGKVIDSPKNPTNRFDGYADKSETEKKILHNVFEKGDIWFRTGDLMKRDDLGYFYFVDRIGDTFRWKGENVATSEVAEAISVFPGVLEANIYGVHVPGHDGRAGMAALVVNDGFEMADFGSYLTQQLPEYARPLFIRMQAQIEATGTFKQRKVDLVKQGFDPGTIEDRIYFNDAGSGEVQILDSALYHRITKGEQRV